MPNFISLFSRSRKPSLTSQTSVDGARVAVENSIRSQADIEADLRMVYGEARFLPPKNTPPGPPSPPTTSRGELNVDLLVDKLRNMSHLSTITENRQVPILFYY